ncbi:thiol-disulfide oxidoreductase DCC family protein [Hahella aquimaris]|uniref:thiol-disulfide oxidoreductase DCC family protein n=1 Tax=Hahella sp. HNIBRBA332 TaxID=3015983 RepID=UPI00273B9CA4|nr:thiol-disulfide oxidoreductase DCC family protein [Hahella sp. HNIBRBA332]WLQ11841.1 thiol-disulfide oxidoreductase DCC family protein [Hahella sp. HNIBRBA332]
MIQPTTPQTNMPPYMQSDDRVVLFDGVCKLCNAWSKFLIKYDRRRQFKMASVQSPEGQAILTWFDMPLDRFDTMLYVEGEHAFEKSEAFLRIIAQFPPPWRYLKVFRILPRFLRDWGYDLIAQNRYSLFGKYDHCLLPTPDHNSRFLQGAQAPSIAKHTTHE